MEAGVVHEGRAIFSLDLHPAYSGSALEGVQLQLEARILRWDEALAGVLLAYSNLQKLPSVATLRPYFPYIQLSVAADVVLFRPKVGAVVCGQVTKLGADFIGMTVLGSINAAVGRQNIRADLQHRPQKQMWQSVADPSNKIEIGCDVIFCVESLRVDGNGVLAVLGSLKESWTGAASVAARKRADVFPDAARWQNIQPQTASLNELTSKSAFRDRVAAAAQAAPRAGKDAANLPQPDYKEGMLPPTETPRKKKRKHSELEASASPKALVQLQKPPRGEGTRKEKRKHQPTPKHQLTELRDGELSGGVNGSASDSAEKKKRKKEKRKAEAANGGLAAAAGKEEKLEVPKEPSGNERREGLSSPLQWTKSAKSVSVLSSVERERTKSGKKRKKTKAA